MDDKPLARMREERIRLRYSARAMSMAIGYSPNTHGQYERGLREPGLRYLIKLADLGVDVCYVLFGGRHEHRAPAD